MEFTNFGCIVIPGVTMASRRRRLQNDLRDKLATLRAHGRAQGFADNRDNRSRGPRLRL